MEMTDFDGLFELGMEDFGFVIPPWTIMESVDEGNLYDSRQGHELKRSSEMLQFGSEKPPKIPKSENGWNNSGEFGGFTAKQSALSPNSVINFPSSSSSSKASRARTSQAQGHIMAERKRREKLGQRFIALSALIPGLKKMDKASVLTDAIKHVKQLQEKIKTLETQIQKNKSMESVVLVKKCETAVGEDDGRISWTSDEKTLPEIEVKRHGQNVLIRLHCEKKKKGILEKVIAEIQKLHLSFVSSNVITLGETTLDISILTTMEEEFHMTIEDIVRSIRYLI